MLAFNCSWYADRMSFTPPKSSLTFSNIPLASSNGSDSPSMKSFTPKAIAVNPTPENKSVIPSKSTELKLSTSLSSIFTIPSTILPNTSIILKSDVDSLILSNTFVNVSLILFNGPSKVSVLCEKLSFNELNASLTLSIAFVAVSDTVSNTLNFFSKLLILIKNDPIAEVTVSTESNKGPKALVPPLKITPVTVENAFLIMSNIENNPLNVVLSFSD